MSVSYSVAAIALSVTVGSAVLTAPAQARCNNFSSVHAEDLAADNRCTAARGITTVNDREVKDPDAGGGKGDDDANGTLGDAAKRVMEKFVDIEKKQ